MKLLLSIFGFIDLFWITFQTKELRDRKQAFYMAYFKKLLS